MMHVDMGNSTADSDVKQKAFNDEKRLRHQSLMPI